MAQRRWLLSVLAVAALAPAWLPSPANPADSPSAWSVLARRDPAGAAEATEEERRVLERLTWEQLQAWLDGADPASIVLDDGRTLATILKLGGFDLSWWVIAGGGGRSGGAPAIYAIDGTVGQFDVGGTGAAPFLLEAGFWNKDPRILFIDSFERGNSTRWNGVTP